jgi:hypothetical protein
MAMNVADGDVSAGGVGGEALYARHLWQFAHGIPRAPFTGAMVVH